MSVIHRVHLWQDVNGGDVEEGASGDKHEDADPELERSQISCLLLRCAETEVRDHVHDGGAGGEAQ